MMRRGGGHPIRDWGDLLQPSLAGCVAWVDSPRELVGAALKTLGVRFNSTPAQLIAAGITPQDVARRVDLLRRQVGLTSSQHLPRKC
jgi:spermidine/putrescine-binding protein